MSEQKKKTQTALAETGTTAPETPLPPPALLFHSSISALRCLALRSAWTPGIATQK